jgi:hypothetical protein
MTPWGLLEPDARTTGTSGSEGGGASQGAPPTRQGLWANLKGCELANRCCATRQELIATARVGSIRARRDPDLLRSFLTGTALTLRITNYREAL